MRRSLLLAAPLLAVAALAASSVGFAKPKADPTAFAPAAHVHLRSAYDVDPSAYLGRFVKTGTPAGAVDEAATYQSACSAFIKPKVVEGGGVFYDEFFNASSGARMAAGIARIADIELGARDESIMRVKYTLEKKIQSVIDDPAGFKACCMQAPDQCGETYVGEFLMGTGAAYAGTASKKGAKVGVEAGVPVPGLDASFFPQAEFGSGMAWYRGTSFPKPVYFAFKLYETGFNTTQQNGCGDWVNGAPRSTEGVYFVGVSPTADSEATARDLAQKNARVQVVKYLGEQIDAGTVQVTTTTTGAGAGVASSLSDESRVQTAASGVARYVRDESWCITPIDNAAGRFYQARVLSILPNTSATDAAKAVTGPAK